MTGCQKETSSPDSIVNLNLMTFNIRFDNPDDGINQWPYRKDYVAAMIRSNDVDVMGTQEVLFSQLNDIIAALPQFTYAGVGRKDGKTGGELSAVFYKKDRFKFYNGGTFWLSENPSAIGVKGWDAAIERIVTWVILQEKITGKKFAFINTHFDHIGQVARRESAKLLLSKTIEIAGSLPVFVTGDLNSTPESEPVQILTNPANSECLTNSRTVAPVVEGPAWTLHGFGSTPLGNRTIIDYIFIKNSVKVNHCSVIFENHNNVYLSDHNPVLVKASI